VHKRAEFAKKVKGLRAKMFNKQRFQEKAAMKKAYAFFTVISTSFSTGFSFQLHILITGLLSWRKQL
jgi:hypothetical protein